MEVARWGESWQDTRGSNEFGLLTFHSRICRHVIINILSLDKQHSSVQLAMCGDSAVDLLCASISVVPTAKLFEARSKATV